LLCGDLPGTENEASYSLRKAANHLATLLRHSALPVLRAGRWNQENPLANQPQPARASASKSTVGTAAWLGCLENLRKLLENWYWKHSYWKHIRAAPELEAAHINAPWPQRYLKVGTGGQRT